MFCVSNHDYWERRDAARDEALPILNLSGILSVRKHCIGLVASTQLQAATMYIRDQIPALLREVELWVQSGAGSMDEERKQAVRETLDALEVRLRRVNFGFPRAFLEAGAS